jgi:3-hydroxyisobutyrate dehydrogenase-like beta-hydroxyacid dehydrogenase
VLFNVSIAAMAEVLPVAARLGLDPQQFSEGACPHGEGELER